ncbi:MAG: AI-2E family transporter [Clostridia bacterium]|nr:AI-2E family transporter [Clostridia bacterium]
MKKDKKVLTKWMYWFSLVFALIVVYKILDSFSSIKIWVANFLSILTPFIVGIIMAYILYIPSRKLESVYNKIKFIRKKSRLLSVLTIYILVIILCIIAIRFLVPAIVNSFQDLVNNFQTYYISIKEKIMSLPEDSILKSENIMNVINQLNNFKIEDYINLDKITQYAQGVLSLASGIFDIFVSMVVSIYLLLERKDIVTFFKKMLESMFNKEVYENIGRYFHRTNDIFCKFLASQFLDAIVVGVLTSIAMSIIGVKYAVMLGLFIGIFNMIPYFGAIIGVVISIFITILTGGLSKAIEMAIVVIILQQIDANIINPKIVGESLKMSPLLVIFSVTMGGAYFGILGMFLAVPVAAVIKLLLCDFIEYKYQKKGKIK